MTVGTACSERSTEGMANVGMSADTKSIGNLFSGTSFGDVKKDLSKHQTGAL